MNQRIHGLKMTNSIDHILKNTIQTGLDLISLAKHIARDGQNLTKLHNRKSPYDLLKKREAHPLEVKHAGH